MPKIPKLTEFQAVHKKIVDGIKELSGNAGPVLDNVDRFFGLAKRCCLAFESINQVGESLVVANSQQQEKLTSGTLELKAAKAQCQALELKLSDAQARIAKLEAEQQRSLTDTSDLKKEIDSIAAGAQAVPSSAEKPPLAARDTIEKAMSDAVAAEMKSKAIPMQVAGR